MDHHQIIENYYGAFRHRNLEQLREILTADFHHLSSFGEWRDRDAMLQAIWPEVGKSWAINLQIFGEPPEFMVRYQHDSLPGSQRPAINMAEFIRFDADKIAEIEVYVGREAARRDSA